MPRPTVWIAGTDDVRLRLPLVAALRTRGFHAELLGTVPAATFADAGVAYREYHLDRWVDPRGDWGACRELVQLFREHRPDIVHAFDTKPAILAPLAAHAAGIRRTVSTITGLGYLFSTRTPLTLSLRPAFRLLQRIASRATEIMVFQNPQDHAYFRAHGLVRRGHDLLIRGSGVQVEELAVPPAETARLRAELGLEGRTVVLMISRLVALKGVREFLGAAAIVRGVHPEVEFLLVGPVSGEGRQAVPVEEVRRAGQVRWLGPRCDVPALLSLADVFVLPTYYREGVPRVLLEAAALGLPLITTAMPGCADVVQHEWNGLLVPPRRAGELAAAILRLVRGRDLRARMGARSRSHVQAHFSLERVADRYAEVYTGLLAGRRQATSAPAA